jgi:catechol 2,3-dioxygenase-like lactoylglutathione lyase family enzyme
MLADAKAYSGLAMQDLDEARTFYRDKLGLRTSEEYGLMWLHLAGGRDTLIYEQPDATPASFTILNFEVDDIDEAFDALTALGVRFDLYAGLEQDGRGVFREDGPNIAWFKDPSGKRAVRTPREVGETAHQSTHNPLAARGEGVGLCPTRAKIRTFKIQPAGRLIRRPPNCTTWTIPM